MDKVSVGLNTGISPRPNVIVSCRGTDGRDNALAVGYCCNCSFDPPMVMIGIVPSRFSYQLIKDSGCFVVNLVSTEQKEAYQYLGSHSGRNEDKLAKLQLKTANGVKVDAPILLDFPVNIECTVVGSIVTGSHEMFVGRIEHVHADAALVDDKGKVNYSGIQLL